MRRNARSTRRPRDRRWGTAALGLATLVLCGGPARAQDVARSTLPLAAPVKVLQTQDAELGQPLQDDVVQPQRPQPTLPSGKLPQYQLAQVHRATFSPEQLQSPRLLFLLALPSRTMLVEAVVTIDGQPFPLARERRIEQIVQAATQAAAADAESPDAAAESPDEVTESSEDAQEPASADSADTVETEESAGAKPTSAPYTLASTSVEFIRRYLAATGRAVTQDEVRWLLANRIDGPVLLLLNDNFQRFRANQRPVFHVLDRDRDGVVSAEELQQAVASFQECDLNRNEIVDYTEIAQAANDPRLAKTDRAAAGKLIVPLTGAASLTGAPATILSRFDANGDDRLDPEELPSLAKAEPDMSLTVSFNTADPGKATLAVMAVKAEYQEAAAQASIRGGAITLPLSDAFVEFSAVQAGGGDQISLGAVNDGYPLLPVLDPNDDGRITVRELRELADRLRPFDRNGDGRLTAEETPPTIRVCFGLGPLAHRELIGIRSVNPRSTAPAAPAPSWFVRMDRNQDNDLTRAEFPGADDQFQSLDANQDGLVSGQEAADYDRKSPMSP